MATGEVHFEVFVRKTPNAPWRLEGATENRAQAVELAESLFKARKVAAARVSKEVLDPQTREYSSYLVMQIGACEEQKKKPVKEAKAEPPCVGPQDLYSGHAREKVGRLLEEWLRRRKVTAFELLHRPDLAESLERSGMEVLHAVQMISVADNQASGAPLHDLIRAYQKLADQTIERVIQAGRKKLFPDLDKEPIATLAVRLADNPERHFQMGGAMARKLADAPDWKTKVDRLLDCAEAAPEEPKARALVRVVVEQVLSEILGSRAGLAELLGPELDRGAGLLALTRLLAPSEVEAVCAVDASVTPLLPELTGPAGRLAVLMRADEFGALRTALGRKVVAELNGGMRLRPSDPEGEIAVLRALATVLTACAGRLLSLEEVQAAFLERSKQLTASEFVTALTQNRTSALAECQALLRMAENVTGALNRRRAAEWITTCVESLKFEREFRAGGPENALMRLQALAGLDRSARRVNLSEGDQRAVCARLGDVGGMIEADSRLLAQLMRSPAALPQKATLLVRMATGELAPIGPAADRAKVELLKLLKAPETRAQIISNPEVASRLRELMAA